MFALKALGSEMGRSDPVIHEGDLKEHDALDNTKKKEPYVYPWRPHYYLSVIVATLLYAIPCGVIGLILLVQAQILQATDHHEEAERKREQSKCCTGLAIAAVFILMIVLLIVFLYPKAADYDYE